MKPKIVLTGSLPDWYGPIWQQIEPDYALRHHTDHDRYVSRLADDRVALILVNGDDPDWRFWTATPKSSPATRRIPIFVISDDPTIREQALLSGADMVLTVDDFRKDLRRLVRDFARVIDPARLEQLDCECQEPLPPLALQGFAQFNQGEFYKQHDSFEELWMATDGPVRDLYRAILQVGVAYYQILRGNHRGARKMLLRSVQWLAVLPDECQGVDVKTLREDSYRVRAELEKLPEDEIDRFDKNLLKPIKMM